MKKKPLRFSVFLKGMAMGIADMIPGVSGGTIALITGVYRELLTSLNNIDLKFFQLIFQLKLGKLWSEHNLNFLISLILGIVFSLIIFSQFLFILITNYNIELWSFFFGLVASSILFLLKKITKWNSIIYFFLFSGVLTGIILQMLKPANFEITYAYIFLSGMISITAMLLPGISGAYILLLMGSYEIMITSLSELVKLNSEYFLNIFIFILGAMISVKFFSKFLSWSFKRYSNQTFSCLTGFMIGSLPTLWPYKNKNIGNDSLIAFLENIGILKNDKIILVLVFILAGMSVVFFLEYLSKKNEQ